MSILSSAAAPLSATAPSPVRQAPARQSILVLGAGAVGSLYGGRLCEAGHDVTFLMRREYDAVAATGLRISSPDGDMFFPQPSIARSIEDVAVSRARRARRKGAGEGGGGAGKGDQAGGMAGGAEGRKVVEGTRDLEGAEGEAYVPVDWVIVTLKSSSFHAIPSLLEDRRVVGNSTRILVLMNGYGLEEDLVGQGIDGKRVFGGMAFVCANRGPVGSGEIAHLKYGKLMIGHYEDDPVELSLVAGLFQGAKVEVETTPCLLHGRWSKCCWNIPFNGLGCILGGKSVDHIVQTPELRRLATLVMADVVKVANVELGGREGGQEEGREGGKIEPSFQEHLFALTDAMGPYMSSTVLDLLGGLPMETEYMFLRPLERAEALGVEVPYLEGVALAVEGIRKSRGL
ncbi:hypothetical protein NSK_006637 [Nannochloropsis salina CCMP1776]|uniref:2-dehydropantoate 2-reductase n=1 Tax=Nannochloropsis salina CCMP1776 TaxID=1027361 RepID=A0A4D9CZR0_9STRA|nr:hypothetical protein NSK_006637 [Nannochloropsis salina CCMP1776]|eukprot:TFJ81969.1 hypothetical protein NSK_006637 [Nannochloropsis salina CCMP1776]